MFDSNATQTLPLYWGPLDHAIELIEDKTSPYRPAYQHLEKELQVLKEFIQDITAQQFI